jgi:hypothetical protein
MRLKFNFNPDWITPSRLARFNSIATLWWLTAGLIITLKYPASILWVAFMSLWANIVSHFAAYIASRAELEAKKGTN